MDNQSNPHGFMLPESFLTQLSEYTRGYMLLVCNEKGELYSHEAYDNPVIKLGLINFADMHIAATLSHMHNANLHIEDDEEDILQEGDEEENDDPDRRN
jgi:hypothetical protein